MKIKKNLHSFLLILSLTTAIHLPGAFSQEEVLSPIDTSLTSNQDLEEEQADQEGQGDPTDQSSISQNDPNIKYVSMPNPTTPRQVHLTVEGTSNLNSTLRSVAGTMTEFINRMSRGKVKLTASIGAITSGSNGPNNMKLKLIPGANSHVPIIGNAISAKHENGHEFGLGHASTQIWASQTKIASYGHEHEPFDPMTISPGVPSFNAPHIHALGWFSATEEAYLQTGIEYRLRLINDGNRDFTSLKSLYYEVPGSNRKFWFSYVKVPSKNWTIPKGMPGTAIAIHSSLNGGKDTNLEGLIGLNEPTLIRSGLVFQLSEATSTTVKVTIALDPNWILIGE
jgi:hypothetical protein